MRTFAECTRFASVALVTITVCMDGFGQEAQTEQYLGTNVPSSQTGQTGAGLGSMGMAVAKSGKADGTGNLQLGGERRPLYRLNRSDVVTLSFTLSPEFDQTLTVQPDGYIALKDAGTVFAQGLTVEELQEAVRGAYRGYLHDPQVAVTLKEFEHPYFVAGGAGGQNRT